MSVPATSVPSESLFSIAGMAQTYLRNRMSSNCLDMLNFVKNHI